MIKAFGITAAVTLASMALPALAQVATETPKPNPFLEAASESIIDIERAEGGGLTGEGWDRLIAEADAAHFFLIGETHSTADIALVASALHREIAPFGYDHLVVEMGPWSTRFADRRHTRHLPWCSRRATRARCVGTSGSEPRCHATCTLRSGCADAGSKCIRHR